MHAPDLSVSRRLLPRFDASPTPFHAVDVVADELTAAGFVEIQPGSPMVAGGPAFVRRGGALVARVVGEAHGADSPVRVIGAHTDSPCLRMAPISQKSQYGYE